MTKKLVVAILFLMAWVIHAQPDTDGIILKVELIPEYASNTDLPSEERIEEAKRRLRKMIGDLVAVEDVEKIEIIIKHERKKDVGDITTPGEEGVRVILIAVVPLDMLD